MPIHGYPGGVITANPVAPTVSSASGVWTTEQQLQAVSQGNWPGYEYPISRSLRFNSADSAYLNRTPASASNRRTWTWSGWVKRGALGSAIYPFLITAYDSSGARETYFNIEGDCLRFAVDNTSSGNIYLIQTTQVFRDPSAWYHIMVVLDTTQATTSDRLKMYVNGTQITAFSTANYPAQNYDATINLNVIHNIGRSARAAAYYYDGYMTEVNFIDGQALTPSSFGLNDPETGVWSPKRYTGTYGTNGFYVNFSDNSNTTAATLGKDYSGNGNNWTPNNFSVTAGAGNDSLVDTPTAYGTNTGVGGEVRGNYSTMNPLAISQDTAGVITYSNGNLTIAFGSGGRGGTSSTIAVSSGKWYSEFTLAASSGDAFAVVGIKRADEAGLTEWWPGNRATSYGYRGNGNKVTNDTSSAYGATFTTNDVIGIALDLDAGTLVFYKNGSSQGTAFSSLSGTYVLSVGDTAQSPTHTWECNFGQRAFAYTAPSGFKALCTQNLPTPTIGATSTTQANDYFNPVLYTGTGSSLAVTGVGFQPDFIWFKNRSNVASHSLVNAITNAYLASDLTEAESAATDLTYQSDGFTLSSSSSRRNTNTQTYVAWNWKANGAGSSNTAGSITSTVSANTTSGFSIVTYTGTGANATVGHGLGVAPSMIIGKRRNGIADWMVGHSGVNGGTNPFNYYMLLNTTAAQTADSTAWQNTSPTSTVFYLGSGGNVNSNGATNVMYCFAPVAGYSAFGSYTGNGSTDGPFVYLGFRPVYVLIKRSSAIEAWCIMDSKREGYNVDNDPLFANLTNTEGTQDFLDLLSNGFKLRSTDTGVNGSGTYIYACFAENPFKYSLAR